MCIDQRLCRRHCRDLFGHLFFRSMIFRHVLMFFLISMTGLRMTPQCTDCLHIPFCQILPARHSFSEDVFVKIRWSVTMNAAISEKV